MTNKLTVMEEFKNNLSKLPLETVLPSHVAKDKFVNVVITAVNSNPRLLSLNRKSLWNSCIECAKDGLIPDGREAALIPFKGNVKYMPMINGITKKARNSGEISMIDSLVVYENDEYDYWVDETGPHFKHRKNRVNPGAPILTYAYAITKDKQLYFEEITEDQMKDIEKCSNGNNTPWKGPFKDEMRRKSAIRRLCKYRLPSNADIENIIRRDDDMYDFDNTKEEGVIDGSSLFKDSKRESPKSNLESILESKSAEFDEAEFVEQNDNSQNDEVVNDLPKEPDDKNIFYEAKGVISNVQSKHGETDGKKWTRHRCELNGNHYYTFSTTAKNMMEDSINNDKRLSIISYKKTVGDIEINEISEISYEDTSEDDSLNTPL